ncbi:MAG: hypothetical protein AAGJ34_03825 [Pseudomonadota bacterium]
MRDLHGRLYFRTRENGAAVFRIDTRNKSNRLEMHPIASIAIRKGEYRPHGDAEISDNEAKEIEEWIAERQRHLKARADSAIDQLIDDIKSAAHWLTSQATDEEAEEISEELLLAMHDLRSTLVRKKANALTKAKEEAPSSS